MRRATGHVPRARRLACDRPSLKKRRCRVVVIIIQRRVHLAPINRRCAQRRQHSRSWVNAANGQAGSLLTRSASRAASPRTVRSAFVSQGSSSAGCRHAARWPAVRPAGGAPNGSTLGSDRLAYLPGFCRSAPLIAAIAFGVRGRAIRCPILWMGQFHDPPRSGVDRVQICSFPRCYASAIAATRS